VRQEAKLVANFQTLGTLPTETLIFKE